MLWHCYLSKRCESFFHYCFKQPFHWCVLFYFPYVVPGLLRYVSTSSSCVSTVLSLVLWTCLFHSFIKLYKHTSTSVKLSCVTLKLNLLWCMLQTELKHSHFKWSVLWLCLCCGMTVFSRGGQQVMLSNNVLFSSTTCPSLFVDTLRCSPLLFDQAYISHPISLLSAALWGALFFIHNGKIMPEIFTTTGGGKGFNKKWCKTISEVALGF